MIESVCTCGQPISLPESDCPSAGPCPRCGNPVHLISAEPLADGAGAGDFDAHLLVERGPHEDRIGHLYLLGGVAPITLGKLSTSHVLLPGTNVSRHHATLTRLDFGPSRWQIEDNQSTNGLWVNDARVEGPHELADNDLLVVGDYELRFKHAAEPAPVMAAVAPPVPGQTCPSCARNLGPRAKICTDCGIYIDTGKPLITAKGIDENDLEEKAYNAIRWISWLSPTGFYPVASEGFGTQKPYALWALVIFTIFTSLVGFVANAGTDPMHELEATANYELWTGDPHAEPDLPASILRHLSAARRAELARMLADRPVGTFHPHQLLTHAFLHGGFMHLAGNMIFMITLGLSVNALIGNVKTLVIYPLLAIAGGVGHFLASRHGPVHPMVGASGAIMGLAGMYLVFFPVHKMYMAAWWRWGLFRGFRLSWKVWSLRGFWVVCFYISFDIIYTALGVHDHTAHWAHLGGFIGGIVIALVLLLTRQVNSYGGDLISVTMGRRAWALLGKPASRTPAPAVATLPPPPPPVPAVPVTSLNFPE